MARNRETGQFLASDEAMADMSEHKAEELGHKMGRIHEGRAFCMHQGCSANVTFSGSLSDLVAKGPALVEDCPWRPSDA